MQIQFEIQHILYLHTPSFTYKIYGTVMNKKILAVILVVIGISTTKAYSQDLEFGLKMGANIFKIGGSAFDEQFRFGYHLGAFGYIGINKEWGVQPELLWSNVNTKVGTSAADVQNFSNVTDISLNYLSIPLILTYKPIPILSLQAGPQFGILVNPHETTLKNGNNAFSDGDISFLLGGQVNLGSLKAGLRYVVGLNNINDISDQDKWSNQGFQIYVGIKIL